MGTKWSHGLQKIFSAGVCDRCRRSSCGLLPADREVFSRSILLSTKSVLRTSSHHTILLALPRIFSWCLWIASNSLISFMQPVSPVLPGSARLFSKDLCYFALRFRWPVFFSFQNIALVYLSKRVLSTSATFFRPLPTPRTILSDQPVERVVSTSQITFPMRSTHGEVTRVSNLIIIYIHLTGLVCRFTQPVHRRQWFLFP